MACVSSSIGFLENVGETTLRRIRVENLACIVGMLYDVRAFSFALSVLYVSTILARIRSEGVDVIDEI